jgi:hypothetical protein
MGRVVGRLATGILQAVFFERMAYQWILTRESGTPTRRGAASGRSSSERRATTRGATSLWRPGAGREGPGWRGHSGSKQPRYDRVCKLFDNYALDEQDPDVVAYPKAQAREQGHTIQF